MKNILQLVLLYLIFSYNAFSQKNTSIYVFGHSLIVHDPPRTPTLSNETTVPHWLHFLAEEANNSVKLSGQYGFLRNHENSISDTPVRAVRAQWNFDSVEQAWDSDSESFTEANFDAILITPANFVQYQHPDANYDGNNDPDRPNTSPLRATLSVLDWVDEQEPNAVKYVYENWSNMTSRILEYDPADTDSSNGRDLLFPPTVSKFAEYNALNLGGFHDWFIEYHDLLQAQRPDQNIKMIPVGPIISKLVTLTPLSGIPADVLYEDESPHGRPTTYFLAALITYMAIYEEKAPLTYSIPTNDVDNPVSPLVQANYEATVNFIWDELLVFNNSDGSSRVFVDNTLSIKSKNSQNITISPNPTNGIVNISSINRIKKIDLFDARGVILYSEDKIYTEQVDLTNLPNGMYFLKIENDHTIFTKRVIKE